MNEKIEKLDLEMEEPPPKFVWVAIPRPLGTSVVIVKELMQLDTPLVKRNSDGSVQYVYKNFLEKMLKKHPTLYEGAD